MHPHPELGMKPKPLYVFLELQSYKGSGWQGISWREQQEMASTGVNLLALGFALLLSSNCGLAFISLQTRIPWCTKWSCHLELQWSCYSSLIPVSHVQSVPLHILSTKSAGVWRVWSLLAERHLEHWSNLRWEYRYLSHWRSCELKREVVIHWKLSH